MKSHLGEVVNYDKETICHAIGANVFSYFHLTCCELNEFFVCFNELNKINGCKLSKKIKIAIVKLIMIQDCKKRKKITYWHHIRTTGSNFFQNKFPFLLKIY